MTRLTVCLIAMSVLASSWIEKAARGQSTNQASKTNQASAKRRETSITGRVVNESGQPIPNATVSVRRIGTSANVSRNLGSDDDGRFHAEDLAPGAYTVSAVVPAYVPETDSPDRQYYRPGESMTLRMIKGAVISGNVTNSAGEPIIAARVNAIRVRDAEGRPIRRAGPGNARLTDDRGGYRLYGLQAGAYLVVVTGGSMSFNPPSGYDGDAPTYYPSATRDTAAEVTVTNGAEVGGIDIRYRGERGHVVSGTLSGSLGADSPARGASISLAHVPSSTLQMGAYVSFRAGERGFAILGVADGEYDLLAQVDMGTEAAAASLPRRIIVKGADITGLEVSLSALGSIAARVVLETVSDSKESACKKQQGARLDETVIMARRDEKPGSKDQSSPAVPLTTDASPDEKGDCKLAGLFAGRYRIETRLPKGWFVRSITAPAGAASKQPKDVAGAGIALSAGQRIENLIVTVSEGAAQLRGKVVSASVEVALPARLRVYLVPAETESSDDSVRFAEAAVAGDGGFSLSNIAPGRYFVLARAASDEELMERSPRPMMWDAANRALLRREAQAANVTVELSHCQRVTDYKLTYTSPSGTKKRSAGTRPQAPR